MKIFPNDVLSVYLVVGGMVLFDLTAIKDGGKMVDKLVISVLFPLVPLYLTMILLREVDLCKELYMPPGLGGNQALRHQVLDKGEETLVVPHLMEIPVGVQCAVQLEGSGLP